MLNKLVTSLVAPALLMIQIPYLSQKEEEGLLFFWEIGTRPSAGIDRVVKT